MKRLEKQLQDDVIKWLKKNKVFYMRTQMGTQSGLPDLIICNEGEFVGIELKREDGMGIPTLQQRQVGQEIKASGGKFFIISSLSDLQVCLSHEED